MLFYLTLRRVVSQMKNSPWAFRPNVTFKYIDREKMWRSHENVNFPGWTVKWITGKFHNTGSISSDQVPKITWFWPWESQLTFSLWKVKSKRTKRKSIICFFFCNFSGHLFSISMKFDYGFTEKPMEWKTGRYKLIFFENSFFYYS